VQCARERGYPFGQIVEADTDGNEQSRSKQLALLCLFPRIAPLGHVDMRNEGVDQIHGQHPSEKGHEGGRGTNLLDPLLQQLTERYKDHHTPRETQDGSHEAWTGPVNKQNQEAA